VAGYVPSLSIGANPGLSADQLWDVSMKSYWQGGSDPAAGVPADIPNRGYQVKQRITALGTSQVDIDLTDADNFGGTVRWCVSPPNPDLSASSKRPAGGRRRMR
jgi:hypothetical protein